MVSTSWLCAGYGLWMCGSLPSKSSQNSGAFDWSEEFVHMWHLRVKERHPDSYTMAVTFAQHQVKESRCSFGSNGSRGTLYLLEEIRQISDICVPLRWSRTHSGRQQRTGNRQYFCCHDGQRDIAQLQMEEATANLRTTATTWEWLSLRHTLGWRCLIFWSLLMFWLHFPKFSTSTFKPPFKPWHGSFPEIRWPPEVSIALGIVYVSPVQLEGNGSWEPFTIHRSTNWKFIFYGEG